MPPGLSAEPYVSGVVRLQDEEGGLLLIASDGLWDVAEVEAVTAAIAQADRWVHGPFLAHARMRSFEGGLRWPGLHRHVAGRGVPALAPLLTSACTLLWP